MASDPVRHVSVLRVFFHALAFLCVLVFSEPAAAADTLRGVALVIGNGDYQRLSKLPNPKNDAREIEDLLGDLGFDADSTTNAELADLDRDIERFVEDAEGADVAILYYAGHAIEAGGENWLVPVDADLSSLDAAPAKLVPLSAVLERLQKAARVAIVMLDACRDNPFPPGALLRTDGASAGAPVTAAGLGVARGAAALTRAQDAGGRSIGTVIAFSAEPGKTALDGQPGAHSPYAAAILRHLGALPGVEFDMVLRMVAEEVYLKTAGRQRPWRNASLNDQLFFGERPKETEGDGGDILAERRQLLLTIAELPELSRAQVERVAAEGGVPMDALFAMLKALGAEAPKDPARLEAVLKAQTERVRSLMAEHDALTSTDPELARLTALSDRAVSEGALATAIRFNEQAKARVQALEPTLERAEADLKARWTEVAMVYARSGDNYALVGDFVRSAQDFATAYDKIARWDARLAWLYKLEQARAVAAHGDYAGDARAMVDAVTLAQQALHLAPRERTQDWARSQVVLGEALGRFGQRFGDMQAMHRALASFEAALAVQDRATSPDAWASLQHDLGTVETALELFDLDRRRLEKAAAAFREVLAIRSRDGSPYEWAQAQLGLGSALRRLGESTRRAAPLHQSLEAYAAGLSVFTRQDFPGEWASLQNNLGNAFFSLGTLEQGTASFEKAAEAYRRSLEVRSRSGTPLMWASGQYNIGNAIKMSAERSRDANRMQEAIASFRTALEEQTRERAPLDWARTTNNLGNSLRILGEWNQDGRLLGEAILTFRSTLEVFTPQHAYDWPAVHFNIGRALDQLGRLEGNAKALRDAVAAFDATEPLWRREADPQRWAQVRQMRGWTQDSLAELSKGAERVRAWEEAVQSWRDAQSVWTPQSDPQRWAELENEIGYRLILIGEEENKPKRFEQAFAALRSVAQARQQRISGDPLLSAQACRALYGIGSRKKDRKLLVEARALCISGRDGLKARGEAENASITGQTLAKVERALASLE